MNISFLGVGSAFSYQDDCNSAYFAIGDSLYFIDMGEKIASKVIDMGLLAEREWKDVYVFITHTHVDHIGSLEPLFTYIRLFTDIKNVHVIHPNKSLIKQYLDYFGYQGEPDYIDMMEGRAGEVSYKALSQVHIHDSYGYLISSGDDSVFYSGDTSYFHEECYEMLKEGKISRIYHEVASKGNALHIGIDELARYVEPEYRGKFTCMHFASKQLKEKCLELGFEVAM